MKLKILSFALLLCMLIVPALADENYSDENLSVHAHDNVLAEDHDHTHDEELAADHDHGHEEHHGHAHAGELGEATASTWLWTILSVLVVSIISLIGISVLGVKKKKLESVLLLLVALAAGTLVGDALLHLIPHFALEYGFTALTGTFVLAGVVALFILERFLHWHHCHKPHHDHKHIHPFAWNILAGDALHNFLDGALIAASYLVSIPVGIATTIAVILHEIPQEIADYGVLVHAGFSRMKALLMNFATALTAVLGAVITLVLVEAYGALEAFLVPFTAGAFIYIAMADLLPELKHEEKTSKMIAHFAVFLLGIGLMALLLLFE